MKKNLSFILLLCGIFFSCNTPKQNKQKTEPIKTEKLMTNDELREKLGLALNDMTAKAWSSVK